MPAEAQRASLREQPNFAQRPPRVVGAATSMSIAAETIKDRYSDQHHDGPTLQIFDHVPPQFGVAAAEYDSGLIRRGEVAVYDCTSVSSEGLIDGAIYVIEYQHARGHLPQRMWADAPNFRMETKRQLVIVRRHRTLEDRWVAHPLRSCLPGHFVCSDGPYEAHHLADKLVGRVVGIYNPTALSEMVR